MMRRGLLYVTILAFAGLPMIGEQLLVSPAKSEFLGWARKNAKFETCPGGYMDVRDGYHVKDTQDKCVTRSASLSGIMERVNLAESSFTFRDNGEHLTFYVGSNREQLQVLPIEEFVRIDVTTNSLRVTWTEANGKARDVSFEKSANKNQ